MLLLAVRNLAEMVGATRTTGSGGSGPAGAIQTVMEESAGTGPCNNPRRAPKKEDSRKYNENIQLVTLFCDVECVVSARR